MAEITTRTVDRSVVLPPGLRQRIEHLSHLPNNWDGEGARSVKASVLADVVEALKCLSQQADGFKSPFVAPTFEGFVQLEWHDKERSLEMEAVPNGWSVVGTMVGGRGNRLYFTAECESSDFPRLEGFYKWFLGDELIWPSP